MSARITVVGIGEDGLDGLISKARGLIDEAEVLVGGERHLSKVPVGGEQRIDWDGDFDAAFDKIEKMKDRRVVVLASGDPLHYGVGANIVRRFGADQRRNRAQCEPGPVPERLQRGRADPAARHQCIELRAVARFLLCHAGDFSRIGAAITHHRQLAGVDPRGAVFAGVIDPDHARDELLGAQVAGQAVVGGALRRHSVGVSRSRAAAPIRVIAAIVAA